MLGGKLSILLWALLAVQSKATLQNRSDIRAGYGLMYEYWGKLMHNLDVYDLMIAIDLPDFNFNNKSVIGSFTKFKAHCANIDAKYSSVKDLCYYLWPLFYYYRRQEIYYQNKIYHIMENDIPAILPGYKTKIPKPPPVPEDMGDPDPAKRIQLAKEYSIMGAIMKNEDNSGMNKTLDEQFSKFRNRAAQAESQLGRDQLKKGTSGQNIQDRIQKTSTPKRKKRSTTTTYSYGPIAVTLPIVASGVNEPKTLLHTEVDTSKLKLKHISTRPRPTVHKNILRLTQIPMIGKNNLTNSPPSTVFELRPETMTTPYERRRRSTVQATVHYTIPTTAPYVITIPNEETRNLKSTSSLLAITTNPQLQIFQKHNHKIHIIITTETPVEIQTHNSEFNTVTLPNWDERHSKYTTGTLEIVTTFAPAIAPRPVSDPRKQKENIYLHTTVQDELKESTQAEMTSAKVPSTTTVQDELKESTQAEMTSAKVPHITTVQDETSTRAESMMTEMAQTEPVMPNSRAGRTQFAHDITTMKNSNSQTPVIQQNNRRRKINAHVTQKRKETFTIIEPSTHAGDSTTETTSHLDNQATPEGITSNENETNKSNRSKEDEINMKLFARDTTGLIDTFWDSREFSTLRSFPNYDRQVLLVLKLLPPVEMVRRDKIIPTPIEIRTIPVNISFRNLFAEIKDINKAILKTQSSLKRLQEQMGSRPPTDQQVIDTRIYSDKLNRLQIHLRRRQRMLWLFVKRLIAMHVADRFHQFINIRSIKDERKRLLASDYYKKITNKIQQLHDTTQTLMGSIEPTPTEEHEQMNSLDHDIESAFNRMKEEEAEVDENDLQARLIGEKVELNDTVVQTRRLDGCLGHAFKPRQQTLLKMAGTWIEGRRILLGIMPAISLQNKGIYVLCENVMTHNQTSRHIASLLHGMELLVASGGSNPAEIRPIAEHIWVTLIRSYLQLMLELLSRNNDPGEEERDYENFIRYNLGQYQHAISFPKHSRKKRQIGLIAGAVGAISNVAMNAFRTYSDARRAKKFKVAMKEISHRQNIQEGKIENMAESMMTVTRIQLEEYKQIEQSIEQTSQRMDALAKDILQLESVQVQMKKNIDHVKHAMYYMAYVVGNLFPAMERLLSMYELMLSQLGILLTALDDLSSHKLSHNLVEPGKFHDVIAQSRREIKTAYPGYDLVLTTVQEYYDLPQVHFRFGNNILLIQVPLYIRHETDDVLSLYNIKTVPVPYNMHLMPGQEIKQGYTQLVPKRQLLAMNRKLHIPLDIDQLHTCFRMGDTYLCTNAFLAQNPMRHTCESAIFLNLPVEEVKKICNFTYFPNLHPEPKILDSGQEVLIANVPQPWTMYCTDDSRSPTTSYDETYVLIKKKYMCQCSINSYEYSVRGSIAACLNDTSRLRLTYTINQAVLMYYPLMQREFDMTRDIELQEPRSIPFQQPQIIASRENTALRPYRVKSATSLASVVAAVKSNGTFYASLADKAVMNQRKRKPLFTLITLWIVLLTLAAVLVLLCVYRLSIHLMVRRGYKLYTDWRRRRRLNRQEDDSPRNMRVVFRKNSEDGKAEVQIESASKSENVERVYETTPGEKNGYSSNLYPRLCQTCRNGYYGPRCQRCYPRTSPEAPPRQA